MDRRILVLVSSLAAAGCQGDGRHATPDGREFPHVTEALDRHAPTDDEIADLFFSGLAGGDVRLSGGAATRGDGSRVEWLRDVRLAADITGNGTDEAVVVLREQRQGQADQLYLAVVGSADGNVSNMGTAPLPGVTSVTSGTAALGRVSVDVMRPDPVRLSFAFANGVLRLDGEQSLAPPPPPPPPSLEATRWRLLKFQSMDDTSLDPERDDYVLAFDAGGVLVVQAACNRGRGTWKADGSALEFGPVVTTRAFCPGKLQQRFVADLAHVRSFVMRDGHLYLALMADAGIYEFEPAAPPAK